MQPALPNWPYIGDARQRFAFERKLGSGVGGSVYLVRERANDTLYALKIVENAREWSDNEWLVLEQLRESTDCLRSGVVCHRGHFIVDNANERSPHKRVPALLIDYVDGPDLFDFARVWWDTKNQAPAATLARAIAKSCLSALAVVHSAGIAHRDIKPENIIVQFDPPDQTHSAIHNVRCTIVDFAYACDEQTCATTRFSGTPCYATATRLQSALDDNKRTEPDYAAFQREQAGDVWALGLSLFFFFTGSQPWPCVVSSAIEEAKTPMPHAIAALAAFADRYSLLDHEHVAGDDSTLDNVLFQMLVPEDDMRITAAAALAALST